MAATLGCNPTRVLFNAPVAGSRNAGEPSTSSIARLQLRGRKGPSKKLSLRLAGRIRAHSVSNEGDKVRELASEKAVESGKQVGEDTTKLAGNGQSSVVLDAKAEDASDAASYDPEVREKVVDVASDTAVDNVDDVDALAKKDAAPLADAWGRSLEDTAEALEAKAAEVSDREARKESSSSDTQSSSKNFFQDQVIKDSVLDVASTSAVDEGSEVEATAEKDASEMTSKVGGDQRRNKVSIKGLADTASKLEADSSSSLQQIGDQIEGLKQTISKNLKEGIDANQPRLEELSRTASQRVKEGQEYLNDAGEVEFSGDAQNVLEDAKGALDKRQSAINLAVEDARKTGELVADLAVKGWDALAKTTEKFVAKFQKNVGELQVTAQEKAEVAKQKAGETAEQAQSTFSEAKMKAEEAAEQAQKQFADAKSNLQAKTDELRNATEEKGSESKEKLLEALEDAQRRFNEAKQNVESKTGELKDSAEEKASESKSKLEAATGEAQSKFGDAKKNVESKTGEFKENAQEKASESKSKLEDTAESAQSKAGKLKEESRVWEVKTNDGNVNRESSSAVGQTPGNRESSSRGSSIGGSGSVVGQTPAHPVD